MNVQKSPRIGVLIVNLGTPDSPKTPDVRKYLRQFLMDGRVIDIPAVPRWLLVNLLIAPLRAPKSAKIYKEVWTENGSPLKHYGYQTEKLLQSALGEEYEVKLAMRYQSPSIKSVLQAFKTKDFEKIIVIPLFPQYASASTGSVQEEVMRIFSSWQIVPAVEFVQQFYAHPLFVQAFAQLGKKYLEKESYDHILFSYHGLPERHIRKGDEHNHCLKHTDTQEIGCCASINTYNRACYRAQCFETTRLLVKALHLPEGSYSTAFQSRLGRDPWIKPYTDKLIKEFAAKGIEKVLAFSPSFVSDCLETTIEIGEEYKELFEERGGKHWTLVESLNESPIWIELLRQMVIERNHKQIPLEKMLQVIAEEKI